MALTKVDDRGLKTPIDLQDNEKIRLGTGNDLELFHNGNHSFITDNGSGNIYISSASGNAYLRTNSTEQAVTCIKDGAVELYHNNNKKLETTANGILSGDHTVASVGTLTKGVLDLGAQYTTSAATPKLLLYNDTSAHLGFGVSSNQLNVNLSSGTFDFCVYGQSTERFRVHGDGAGVDIPDNAAFRFGNSQDLKLYHNGIQSYIDNSTGRLKIRSNAIKLSNLAEDHAYFLSNEDGSSHDVQLYYDNVKKFQTTSTGATVTGSLYATGSIDVQDNGALLCGDADDLQIFHNGSGSFIDAYTTDLEIRNSGGELMADFRLNNAVDLYHDGTKRLSTHSQGAIVNGHTLYVKGASGEDARLFFIANNSASYNDHYSINVAATGAFAIQTEVNANTFENLITATQHGNVELYHDNSKKLETTSAGATVTGTLTATAFSGAGIIPAGGIIIWSGASNAIPTGWLLCDGTNSTPDLRNRFVVGAGNSYSVGATGGADSVTLTTAQIPSHNHSIQIRTGIDDNNFSFNQGFSSDRNDSGGTFNSNNTGGGQSHENRPPYYALCYIMKS